MEQLWCRHVSRDRALLANIYSLLACSCEEANDYCRQTLNSNWRCRSLRELWLRNVKCQQETLFFLSTWLKCSCCVGESGFASKTDHEKWWKAPCFGITLLSVFYTLRTLSYIVEKYRSLNVRRFPFRMPISQWIVFLHTDASKVPRQAVQFRASDIHALKLATAPKQIVPDSCPQPPPPLPPQSTNCLLLDICSQFWFESQILLLPRAS